MPTPGKMVWEQRRWTDGKMVRKFETDEPFCFRFTVDNEPVNMTRSVEQFEDRMGFQR